MSPAATNTPPVKVASNGAMSNRVDPSAPSITRTRVAMPGPVPTTRSGTPSPLKSSWATRTPPAKSAPNGVADWRMVPSVARRMARPDPDPVPNADPIGIVAGTTGGTGGTGGIGGTGGTGGIGGVTRVAVCGSDVLGS